MKYVLDSNVVLKWVLPEADSDKAIRIRDEFGQGIHQLLGPDVFPIEVAHSLARAERRGDIKQGQHSRVGPEAKSRWFTHGNPARRDHELDRQGDGRPPIRACRPGQANGGQADRRHSSGRSRPQ
jgi:hypothetical protein